MLRKKPLIALSLTCMLLLASDAWAGPAASKQAQQWLAALWIMLPAAVLAAMAGVGTISTYRATFRHRSERVVQAATSSPVKSFILGAANTSLLLVLANVPGVADTALATLPLGLLLLLAFMGAAAKAETTGARIAQAAGREVSPITSILIGWPALLGIAIIPFVGWGVVFYIAVCGVGAAILSFFGGRADAEEQGDETDA